MPQRFAVIDSVTNKVKNVIMLSFASEWGWAATQKAYYVIQSDTANIGQTYNKVTKVFS